MSSSALEGGSLPKSRSFSSYKDIELPSVARISPRVVRILGFNPGSYTLQGTNTYLVGTGSKRILVDCGEKCNKNYLSLLKETLDSLKVSIQDIMVTHWHHDHVGGAKSVIEALVPAKDRPRPVLKIKRKEVEEPTSLPDGYKFLKDMEVVTTEGATLRVVHTPGHTDDHMGLLLEEERTFFSGDCILGHTRPVFEDMALYERSLRRIQSFGSQIQRIFPGHGAVIEDPGAKLRDYLRSIERREKLLLDVLKKAGGKMLSTAQIVDKIYLDTAASLKWGAMIQCQHHLEKLEAEGLVFYSKIKEVWGLAP